MNQPNPPAIPTRTAAPAEGPDVLQVLRRYALLVAAGTIVGAMVAGGLYAYFRKYQPRYKAFVQYQVLPPTTPLGETQTAVVLPNPDEISQFIHRQVHYITQDHLLDMIIQSKEFQQDPNSPDDSSRHSQWLMEHRNAPRKSLKKDLSVTPIIDSASFEISMTCRDPAEACSLVKAAAQVYMDNLKADNRQYTAARLESLNKVRRDQEQTVGNLSLALTQYRQSLNIPALTARQTIELESLRQMNQAYLEAQSKYNAAKMSFDKIQEQTKNLDPNNPVITPDMVTPDMDQFVQEDFEMRTLQDRKLSLEQEMAAAEKQGSNPTLRNAIQARLEKVAEQIQETKKNLLGRAMQRVKERMATEFSIAAAQQEFISKLRKDKEEDVKNLDTSLVQYQQKVDELKAQEEVLERLRRQDTLQTLATATDDTRVQQIVSAVQPDANEFVWPSLMVFLPVGIVAGFGLSFLAAYLLVMTDTRVRTPRDITKTLQLPLLGFIPDESDDRALNGDVATAMVTSPSSMIAESFRQIRSHLVAQTENTPVSTLLVASIAPGGGATTVASNLAAGMALNDRRVLLVDANLYRPSLNQVYKNLPVEGFSDLLEDPALLSKAIVPSGEIARLHVLGAGRRLGKGSSEVFESKAFRELLDQLKSRYDLIIFDGAPLNLVSDSMTLASRVDGIVSVIRAGEISRGTVSRIRDQLRQVHANLLGFVLNAAQANNTGYFKENYRTFYRYAGDTARRAPVGAK